MDLEIKGRTALVAGASDGIGKGIALRFAKEGVNLALCARSEDLLEAVAEEARSHGVKVVARAVDAFDGKAVAEAVNSAGEELGAIDILVNTIGGSTKVGPLVDIEDDDWLASMNLNLLSCARFARAVIPGMQERQWGRVVFFSTIGAQQVTPAPANLFVEYGTSKSAVIAMTKYASEHVAKDNVLVNCICPGAVITPRSWGGAVPQDFVEARIEMTPMGRLGSVDEIADLALFLSSERCTYITGTAIPIDGGNSRAIP